MARAFSINNSKKIVKQQDMTIQEALNALFEVMENKINCRKLLKEFIGESGVVAFHGAHDRNKVRVEVVVISNDHEFSQADYEGIALYVKDFVSTCFKTERFLNEFNPFLALAETAVTVNEVLVHKVN